MKQPFKIAIVSGIVIVVGFISLLRSPMREGVIRLVDAMRGYRLEFPAESIGDFMVTVVQEPGDDFYDTYFQITASDGRSTRLMIDGDDEKWKLPRRVEKQGRIYYLCNDNSLSRCPMIESEAGVLHTGYVQGTYKLSEIDLTLPYQERRSITFPITPEYSGISLQSNFSIER